MRRATHRMMTSGGLAAAAMIVAACGANDGRTTDATMPEDEAGDTAPAAANTPVAIENCGMELTVEEPPRRAVALNQPATEILLALGVREQIASVAGAPDEDVAPQVVDEYAEVNVLVEEGYPSAEALLGQEPDFIYASYPSAYRDDGIGSRERFASLSIPTYLSSGRCPDRPADEPMTIEDIWAEIEEMGAIFGASEAAEQLVAEQRAQYEQTLESLEGLPQRSVFWWDMKTDAPFVGACCGAPAMVIDALGFENIFDDVPGHWADASWEQVVERDPDMIVVADFGDGDIDTKLEFIRTDPTLSQLRAVQNDAIVTLPFAMTTPGIQTITAIGTVAEGARDLAADT